MALDTEVEKVLQEIRQNLTAEAGERKSKDDDLRQQAMTGIESSLAVTERAWNQLPPVRTYRHGWTARLELWIKRQSKRATRWYAWEQINFNAAVNNALRTILSVLSAHERQQSELQAQINELAAKTRELQELRTELEQLRREARLDVKAQ